MIDRRQFVRIVPALGVIGTSFDATALAQVGPTPAWPAPPPAEAERDESFPSHHPFLAKEMVGASHGNMARVKELLGAQPELAKASWDWGFGDWETALGAASHVGNRAIAELLLEHGAAPTIFSAAMLGQLDVVKAFAAAMPNITPNVNQLRGPHGIPLINHARAGGAGSAEVVKFLESLGGVPAFSPTSVISQEDAATISGRYQFGNGPRDVFVVDVDKTGPGILRPGGSRRVLRPAGSPLEFQPAGAPMTRITFERIPQGTELKVYGRGLVLRALKSA